MKITRIQNAVKIDGGCKPEAFPSQLLLGTKYALTLSSNYARKHDSILAYNHVIKYLPEGWFEYTFSKSDKGKYHIHGIWVPKYSFDYINLMASKDTEGDYHFDIHIHYDLLKTKADLSSWKYYITHQPNSDNKLLNNLGVPPPGNPHFFSIPKCCIPEVQTCIFVKSMKISGL